jgi:hypothetical protein
MRIHLGTYGLYNRHTKAFEDAIVFEGIVEKNLVDFETIWRPALADRIPAPASQTDLIAANIQDRHWDWRQKAQVTDKLLEYQSFAVEADAITQGLMITSSISFCRLPSQKAKPLIYVDFLAAAPWNRPNFTPSPKYRGVGKLLIFAAMSQSLDEGYEGRIGLHSLHESETFYQQVFHMQDLGPDTDHQGLRYFEMTDDIARDLLQNRP